MAESLRRSPEDPRLPAGRGIPEGDLDTFVGGIGCMHVNEDGQGPAIRGGRKDLGGVADPERAEGSGSLIIAPEDLPLEAAPVRLAGLARDVAAEQLFHPLDVARLP